MIDFHFLTCFLFQLERIEGLIELVYLLFELSLGMDCHVVVESNPVQIHLKLYCKIITVLYKIENIKMKFTKYRDPIHRFTITIQSISFSIQWALFQPDYSQSL